LQFATSHPTAGSDLLAHLTVTDAQGKAVVGAHVTFVWNMLTMDMGTSTGTARSTSVTGVYDLHVTAAMSGYWRLTVTLQLMNQADENVIFDVPIA
jgi:hypothetical protein